MNPLYNVPEFPEYDKVKPEHVKPAIDQLIKEAQAAMEKAEANPMPTWDYVITTRNEICRPLFRSFSVVSHMMSVCNSDEWREAYEAVLPDVITFSTMFSQSEPFYNALKKLVDSPDFANLDPVRQRILKKNLEGIEDSGIGLQGEERERFNELTQELSKLTNDFSNNVLDATKAFSITITDKAKVEGMPETLLSAMSAAAKAEGADSATAEDGPWRVSLDPAIYGPFMQYCADRELREKLYIASITRASSGEIDNQGIIEQILAKRSEKVKLLGYNNYAEKSTKAKMAGSPDKVFDMYDRLEPTLTPIAQKEADELEAFARENGFSKEAEFMPWDSAFWSRIMLEKTVGISPEELRPYFQFEKVLAGLFALLTRLTGYRVELANGMVPVWHPDVRFFKLLPPEGNDPCGWLYLDPYSRPGEKNNGAWMNDLNTRERLATNEIKLPAAFIVCNQMKPVEGKPSCMTYGEVTTLFHEFGHAIQHLLTTQELEEVSGINGVEWDAVELASQFMENWASRKEVLKDISEHITTGEALPEDMMAKIKRYDNFRAASGIQRQLNFGYMDMLLHSQYPSEKYPTIASVEDEASRRFPRAKRIPNEHFLCTFSHIFAGGYAAGYYSYMWADILAADAYRAFDELGDDEAAIRELGRRYTATILGLGGAYHPMEVFKSFRGREPNPDSILINLGLI